MNNWKISFWCCLTVLVLVTGFLIYSGIDQGVTSTYQKEGYAETESDFDNLIEIINHTDLSRAQIENELKSHRLYGSMDFNTDTISLNRILLIFKSNKLKKLTKQW